MGDGAVTMKRYPWSPPEDCLTISRLKFHNPNSRISSVPQLLCPSKFSPAGSNLKDFPWCTEDVLIYTNGDSVSKW